MKPATLGALLRGDLENAIIAETPGGIEAQEAVGQRAFVANDTLPIRCDCGTREQFEQMGIVFGEPVDDLFVEVQLPSGWCKKPTEHSIPSTQCGQNCWMLKGMSAPRYSTKPRSMIDALP